jgi:lysozyme
MLNGTDLAYSNVTVNYEAMAASGIQFAYLKIGQGLTITDPMYAKHRAGCQAAGVLWGAYYFADYRYSATPQAAKLCYLLGDVLGDLIPALDLEYEERLGWPRPSGASMAAWTLDFLREWKKQTGKPIIFYTNPDLIHELKKAPGGIPAEILACPLWIAHYTTQAYLDFEPWKAWTFWQEAGDVKGSWSAGGVDYDYFNGTLDQLKNMAGGSVNHVYFPNVQTPPAPAPAPVTPAPIPLVAPANHYLITIGPRYTYDNPAMTGHALSSVPRDAIIDVCQIVGRAGHIVGATNGGKAVTTWNGQWVDIGSGVKVVVKQSS